MNKRNTDPIAGLTGKDRYLALMGIPLNEIEATKSAIDELRRNIMAVPGSYISWDAAVRLYHELVRPQVRFDAAKVTESLAQLSTPQNGNA
jgi:hypothetical protein